VRWKAKLGYYDNVTIANPPGPFQPDWGSLDNWQVPEWYLDAKFGIFIHWGVYSVPAFANEWYARHMYVAGTREHEHHLATYGPHTQFGYKDFIPQFKAELFDPGEWTDLFVEAGAKFVVPVAEHHDGFMMYGSRLSKWNALEMGPKRDIVAELGVESRKRGLIFGVSSHRAEHWWFMNGGRDFPSDVQDPELQDFYGPAVSGSQDFGKNPPNEAFLEDWLARCTELVDKVRPQLFWFDWWIEQPEFKPYLRRFASYYYNKAYAWGQGVAINYKNEAFSEKSAVFDVERGQLSEIRDKFWQTDTAVAKNSWSHVGEMDYKSPADIIHDLIDIVSKNGALLLNIGPKSDGSIPEGDKEILREVGAWLKVNGEAVYGTRPFKVYGEGPTRLKGGSFTDGEARPVFTKDDMRFTKKGDNLYVTVLVAAGGPVLVRSLATGMTLESRDIAAVSLLGGGELKWSRDESGLRTELPEVLPSRHAVCLKVTFK
jgi:alpha-L-fucosidase